VPGLAQVWLTHKEIGALLEAAPNTQTRVNEDVWRGLEPKLTEALGGVACPVPGVENVRGERCPDGSPGDYW